MDKTPLGTILVVSANPADRHELAHTLRLGGHTVHEAASGAAAIELAGARLPELVVADAALPERDIGARLAAEPATEHIPVLWIGGAQDEADISLPKPVAPPALLATVTVLLRMQRSERQLRAVRRACNGLLSIASHDLRTPLSAMQLTLELISRQIARDGGHPLKPHVERLGDQTRRLTALLEHLLDLAQIEAGRLRLTLEPVDLAALTREVVARQRAAIEAAGCAVTVDAEAAAVGCWDRRRLERIVAALLANALKYGAGNPVALRLTCDGDRARLEVRDHGIGIEPARQCGIFQRVDPIRRRDTGSYGLNLWVARNVIEALGGNITVDSAPGQGATFRLTLPLRGPAQETTAH